MHYAIAKSLNLLGAKSLGKGSVTLLLFAILNPPLARSGVLLGAAGVSSRCSLFNSVNSFCGSLACLAPICGLLVSLLVVHLCVFSWLSVKACMVFV